MKVLGKPIAEAILLDLQEEITSQNLTPLQKVQLPISDEEIIEGLEKPYTSSWRWLSELGVYLLGQAHIALKTIHGKVVRVLKR